MNANQHKTGKNKYIIDDAFDNRFLGKMQTNLLL